MLGLKGDHFPYKHLPSGKRLHSYGLKQHFLIGKTHYFDWAIFDFANCNSHYQRVSDIYTYHIPMIFPWYSHSVPMKPPCSYGFPIIFSFSYGFPWQRSWFPGLRENSAPGGLLHLGLESTRMLRQWDVSKIWQTLHRWHIDIDIDTSV